MELNETQSEILEVARQEMAELSQLLEEENADIDSALEKINNNLRQYPELTVLLDDEEIIPFYRAYSKKAAIVTKKATSRKKGKLPSVAENGKDLTDLL